MARGGARPGAGRKKGSTATQTTRERAQTIADLARQYTDLALKTLVDVCRNGQSEAARVAASNAIIDRGYGKPPQALEHSGPGGGPVEVSRIERVVVNGHPQDTDAKGVPALH